MSSRPAQLASSALRLALAAALAAGCVRRAPPPPAEAPRPKAEVTPAPRARAAPARNPHDAAGGEVLCRTCHLPGASVLKKDAISLCADCHDPALMRHPFRVEAPAGASGVPLEDGHTIMCHTCHDPHDVKARRAGLRMPYGELCLKCHVRHSAKDGPAAPRDGEQGERR